MTDVTGKFLLYFQQIVVQSSYLAHFFRHNSVYRWKYCLSRKIPPLSSDSADKLMDIGCFGTVDQIGDVIRDHSRRNAATAFTPSCLTFARLNAAFGDRRAKHAQD